MKTTRIAYILLITITSVFSTGCSDFLEVSPNNLITQENFYQTEENFQAATAPLYNYVWFDFNDKFYYGLGDGRGYNLYAPFSDYIYPFSDLTETGTTGPLVYAWQSFYTVIQQSNRVIIGINGSDVDSTIKSKYIGEARFMRGVAYWYLASLWGEVIISEDPSAMVSNPVVNKHRFEDVYEFAMRDLEFAAKTLDEAPYQEGRVCKYSAYAMLSRVYLTYAGYYNEDPALMGDANKGVRDEGYLELAQKAALKVIEEGPYELMDTYYDLFMIENNNNSESIFALQWVPNGDYGLNNMHQNYFAAGSEMIGSDKAWGYWTRASYDVLQIYESSDIRRHDTWMGYGDVYEDINRNNGGYTYEKTETALNVKKGVVGSSKDNANITDMNSALNTYMIRLAEVYLNYCDAVLGDRRATNDAIALEMFNALRTRAHVSTKRAITGQDIFNERRRELCMEGQFWYDLVRKAYYSQQEVLSFIEGQSRDVVIPFTYNVENNTTTYDDSREESEVTIGNIDASIFLLPYPESEVVQNPLLKEAPVAFEFTEDRITDLFD